MTKSRKREYWIVQLLFAVFLLIPMVALAQESNTQSVRDPDILHDVALSFVTSSDGFSAGLERAVAGTSALRERPPKPIQYSGRFTEFRRVRFSSGRDREPGQTEDIFVAHTLTPK
jgi:hypothetical protein